MPELNNLQPTQEEKPRRTRRGSFLIAITLFFAFGLFAGRYVVPAGGYSNVGALEFVSIEEGERKVVFPAFWEAWDELHNNFIGDLEDKDLFYGSVMGMVRAAGDPYTVFSPPEESKQFQETINGSFAGVGIEIGIRNRFVTVITPLRGTPADKAGILEGDIIIEIDKEPITQDMNIDHVVRKIRGPKGEDVILTIVREGENQTIDITITRGDIEIESVKMNIENGIAHIEITNFNGDTSKRFMTAAREVKKSKVKGIIVDVRNNPGGFLTTAVEIASRFIPKGEVVVSEEGKESKEYKAEGNSLLEGIPVVVLINGGSASASEILAGALQDKLNSPIIGTKSFGKGSVQELIKISDGSSLKVTVAKWFTPNGHSIDKEGIEPTIEQKQDRETEEDEILNRGFEEINKLINESENE